jgi:hypothetical protein
MSPTRNFSALASAVDSCEGAQLWRLRRARLKLSKNAKFFIVASQWWDIKSPHTKENANKGPKGNVSK